jgi:hypothetical protein
MSILWIATGYQFFKSNAWFFDWDTPIRFGYHAATVLAAILAGVGLSAKKSSPTPWLVISQVLCWSYVACPLLVGLFVGIAIWSNPI